MDILSLYSHHLVTAAALVAALLLLLRIVWTKRRTGRRIRLDMLSVLLAVERLLEGDLRDMNRWLRRVIRRYPDDTGAFILFADLLRREGSPLKATFLLRTLLHRSPLADEERAAILLALGRAHRLLGDDEKALAAFKQSLAAASRQETLAELIELERTKGLFEDALFHQRELNRLRTDASDEPLLAIMLEAAEHALTAGDLREASRWIDRAARQEADLPRIFSVAAFVCAGNTARATESAVACVERTPDEEITLRFLLLNLPGGKQLLTAVPGKWASLFLLLADEQRSPAAADLDVVEKNTVLYYHLAARSAPPGETRDLLAAVGRRERIFACRACGHSLTGLRLACPACGLPAAVKWGTI